MTRLTDLDAILLSGAAQRDTGSLLPIPETVSGAAARVAESGDYSLVWEGHKAGRDIGYCHMEKLTNLDQLPDYGFTVSCFPAKIKQGSAGWTRAVAIFDEV